LYVGFGPIKQIISSYVSLGRGRTHDLLARAIMLCYIKYFHIVLMYYFYVLLFLMVATMIHLSEGL
jgi:hypothetical protein